MNPAHSTASVPSFASRVSFEHFQALRRAWDFSAGIPDRSGDGEAEAERDQITSKFESLLGDHLVSLRDAGALAAIEDVQGRDLAWPNAWNRFVTGENLADVDRLVAPLMSTIQPDFISRLPGAKGCASEREAYASMIQAVDAGALDLEYRLEADCTLTGVRPFLKIGAGWAISAHREPEFGPKTYPRKLVPLGPVPPVELVEVRIPVPSGKLMVADWFRVKDNAFTNAVFKRTSRAQINYEYGKVQETQNHAMQAGVLKIFSGGGGTDLIREGAHMVMGVFDEEHHTQRIASKDVLASVICDLWWTTAVDVEVFKDLLRQELGTDEGEAAAAAFLADGSYTTVDVAPGELFVYLPSVRGHMREFECETEEVSMQYVDDMFAVLSSEPLTWRRWEEERPQVTERPR